MNIEYAQFYYQFINWIFVEPQFPIKFQNIKSKKIVVHPENDFALILLLWETLKLIRYDYSWISFSAIFLPSAILYAQLIELFWEFGINNENHSTLFCHLLFLFYFFSHSFSPMRMANAFDCKCDILCVVRVVFLLAIKTFYSYWNIGHNINFNLLTVILWNFK